MHPNTLRVLRRRNDIACVLINPLQAMHPNKAAPTDSTLVDSSRHVHYDKGAYADWLQQLRQVCTEKGIALIMDEVFMGFRLAPGCKSESHEYFIHDQGDALFCAYLTQLLQPISVGTLVVMDMSARVDQGGIGGCSFVGMHGLQWVDQYAGNVISSTQHAQCVGVHVVKRQRMRRRLRIR